MLSTSLIYAQMQAPAPVGQQPGVAQPFKPVGTQPMAPAPMQPGVVSQFTPGAPALAPAVGPDLKGPISMFQQLIATFNSLTPAATLQQYITQFLTTLVSPAQTSSTISVDDMNSIKTLNDQFVSVLANINNSLANQPAAAQERSMITTSSTNLRTQSTQLGVRLEKNKKIMMQLTQTRGVPNTQFALKLSQYTTLLSQFDATTVDPVKTTLVTDLYALMTYAHTAKGTEANDLKQLLVKAQANPFFSPQIKAELASIAAGQAPVAGAVGGVMATTMPATQQAGGQTTLVLPTGGMSSADAVFQAKLKEVNARTQIVEKVSGALELLILAGQTPSQAMKNSIIGLANQIFASPATMTGPELTAIHDFLVKIDKQQFMLSQNQRPAVESWIKLCEQALPFVVANQQLLVAVKTCLGQYQQAYSKAIQAALLAMKLLATKLLPQEINKANGAGLVGMLRQDMVAYYNARANRSLDDLKGLLELLTLASKRSNLVDVVQKRWLDGLNLTIALTTAESQKAVLDKVNAYTTASNLLQSGSDRSDKSRMLDGLHSMFVNRKDFAQAEVGGLHDLIAKLLAPLYKRKNVFDTSQTTQLTTMFNVLEATVALLTARSADLATKLAALTKAIPLIDLKTMAYEQQLFVSNLNDLFSARGDMMRSDLMSVVTFFALATQQGQKTGKLLTPDQVATLLVWTQEEQYAQATATADKSYVAAVIDQATQTKSLPLAQKAITLFTKNTPAAVKTAFAAMLDGLFAIRTTLNPTDLKNFLTAADAQKLTVMPPEKRDSPHNDLQTLAQEVAVSTAAPATQKR
jgi:hypothetical protein